MAGLSLNDLKKRPGRLEAFCKMIKDGDAFKFEDGNARVIAVVSVDSINFDSKSTSLLFDILESSSKASIKVTTKDKKVFPLSKVSKSKEFGGQSAGSTTKVSGGAITEVLSENGFCFYMALLVTNQIDKFDKKSFDGVKNKSDYVKLINQLNLHDQLEDSLGDSQLDKYIPMMHSFLSQGWDDVLRTQVKTIKKKFGRINSSFQMARSGAIPDQYNPYSTYNNVKGAMKVRYGFGTTVGPDKWNPADLWMYNDEGIRRLKALNDSTEKLRRQDPDSYKIGLLNIVNKEVYDMYKDNVCFPLSLKKTGSSPKITEENRLSGEVEKIVEYKGVVLGPNNVDVKFNFTIKIYESRKLVSSKDFAIKMKTGSAGGFRLEIEGGSGSEARYGSVGPGLYQWITRNTDGSGIYKLNTIRNSLISKNQSLRDLVPVNTNEWFNGPAYLKKEKSKSGSNIGLIPYLNELYEEINGIGSKFDVSNVKSQSMSASEKILNKTAAAEIAIAITKITNKYAREIVLENIVDVAASQELRAGITPEQVERRKRQLEGKIDQDLEILPIEAATTVFTGCFHLKIS